MASEKTTAIVLRTVPFSETSLIVTLFTREFGKVGALAKGARRPKGPFESALDLLAVCRIVFIRKNHDVLDLLTEAKLERRFRASSRDLVRLYAGYYVAELLAELTDTHDPHPELFDAAERTLLALDGDASPASVVLWFELQTLMHVGHAPALDACAACGKDVELAERVPFGLQAGGVLCRECRQGQRNVVSMSPESVRTLQSAASSAGMEAVFVPSEQRGELRGLMNTYLTHLTGHRLRLQSYLNGLTAGD